MVPLVLIMVEIMRNIRHGSIAPLEGNVTVGMWSEGEDAVSGIDGIDGIEKARKIAWVSLVTSVG
jgi:hypothetical protein